MTTQKKIGITIACATVLFSIIAAVWIAGTTLATENRVANMVDAATEPLATKADVAQLPTREEIASLIKASVAEAIQSLPTREAIQSLPTREEMTSLVEASVAEATRPLPTREEMTSLVEASVAEATRPLPTREEMTSLVEASVAEATRPLPTREEMTSLVEASVTEGILPVATRNEIQALTLKVDAVNAQSIRSNTILLTVMDCIIDLNSTDPAAQRDLPGSCQRAQERAEQELRP